MKLALCIASLGAGGAERVLTSLAGGLHARGHQVFLVTLSDEAGDHHPVPRGVARVALGLLAPSSSPLQALRRNLERLLHLRRAIGGIDPDAVVSFGDATNVLALLACLGRRSPVIISERIDPRHHAIDPWWSNIRRATYPLADALVMQTNATRPWAARLVGAERTHVIPNPVMPVAAHAERRDERVLGIGRLNGQKGFDVLLRAFAQVAATHPGWTLELLGEGAERPALVRLAAQLGIADRVALPGVVPDPGPALSRAAIYVLSSRYEGFPNALLEAMAHGTAVIATDCPSGPSEIVRDGEDGLLVPVDDAGALAAAMARLMDDPAERDRLGARARTAVERYAPAAIFEEWERLIERLAARRRRSST